MWQIKILKIMMTFLFFLIIIISCYSVTGHQASNVDLEYDFDNQKLTVTITHNSKDINTHYIEKVEVYKNGVNIIDEVYTSQSSTETFNLTFDVSADDGNILKVETDCNLGGKTEDSITVKSGGNGLSTENDDTSTPGFELLITILGIIIFMILKRKK